MARKAGYATSSDGSLSTEQLGRFTADWNAGLSAALQTVGVKGLDAGFKGSWTDASGVKHSFTLKEAIGKDEVAQFNKAHGATMTNALETGFKKALTSTDTLTQRAVQGTTLGKSMSEAVRKSETLTMSENASSSMGTGVKTRLDTIAGNIQQQAAQGNMGTYRRLQGAYMELANGGLKGSALENFNTRVRTMADAHGGNLLMGQQIATLEYMSKAENGRLGDFAEITNSAIGTNFVAENGFVGDHKMPEPEKVKGDFSQVGYRGDPNLRQNVQSGVQTTGGEVKQATGKPEAQYAKTGANPEKHFQNSTKETEAVNARNQGGMIHKQFKQAENTIQNAAKTTGATSMRDGAPVASVTRVTDEEKNQKEWRNELNKAFDDLPSAHTEGVREYMLHDHTSYDETQKQLLESVENDSRFSHMAKSGLGKVSTRIEGAENKLREDVVNAYKAHYGKNFSEEKYKHDCWANS